jgi:hypothetical protein
MVPAYSYSTVCNELTSAFKSRYPQGSERKVRMTGLLFAKPTSPLAAAEVIPNLDYYHHRSGDNIDFFCAGYGMYWENWKDEIPDQKIVGRGQNREDWLFSNAKFNDFRKEIESMTKWEYSGGVDLILTNARYDAIKDKAHLDFATAMAMNLDKAKSDDAIVSAETFFEQIFRYADSQSGDDPTWGFSDRAGLKVAGSAFKSLILSFIPESIRVDVGKAFHFYVKDINQK